MLYVPSLFSENLMDDWMDDFESEFFGRKNPLYGKHARNMMKTDVKETDNGYEVAVDLPGFKKDEISLELKDGYLTITASKGLDKDEEDKKGRMIRQERYAGAMSRSFYVGDGVTEEEVKAKFENGVLMLSIPKKEEKSQEPERKLITIE
ncbi:MAG TPA: Hsp20/alpha crystallin family protein [Candidatus Lachnoclostridium pullistercoris]|uniref:Hsp20/alpha crystallin family protein n=1 Tax=Candidatus Lachnoclostridium pullistercoris TaxID=2838632 RepID=A0A9D2PBV5_9FIRM|nr:Hsp20/alpha crystallin family protein [Candidatus Lachnoclostridium pullistercoris]